MLSRNRGNQASRWTRAGFNVVKRAYPFALQGYKAYKAYKSATPSKPRGSYSTGRVVTAQHDFTTNYRRRRAPRRVRRRAVRSYKRFTYQVGKTLGQQSRVFPDLQNPGTINPTTLLDSQSVAQVLLYGGETPASTGSDLYVIASDNGLLANEGKIMFKSAQIETQVRNDGESEVLVCEVYKVVARREGYDNPGQEWAQSMDCQPTAPGAAAAPIALSLNLTPFDAPGFGSKWLILSKQTFRIAPGNSVYLEWRDPKNHVFDTSRMNYDTSAGVTRTQYFKGLSKGYLMVFRSADLDATNTIGGPFKYKIISTKTYRYGILKDNVDQRGFGN